jgi:hypothetical protein
VNEDWQCHGWDDHESFMLETGRRMPLRNRLLWLEGMHEMVLRMSLKRPMIYPDGTVLYPPDWKGPRLEDEAPAEGQTAYNTGTPARDKRGEGTPPTVP